MLTAEFSGVAKHARCKLGSAEICTKTVTCSVRRGPCPCRDFFGYYLRCRFLSHTKPLPATPPIVPNTAVITGPSNKWKNPAPKKSSI